MSVFFVTLCLCGDSPHNLTSRETSCGPRVWRFSSAPRETAPPIVSLPTPRDKSKRLQSLLASGGPV